MSFPKALPTSRVRSAHEAPALHWGILGTGWIAEKFTESVKAHTKQVIAAVGSREPSKAQAFAARWDVPKAHGSYEALVADANLDVIYVATPHNFHHEHALLAIEAGKHVLVEKPIALNRAQAEQMVAAARRKGVFFAEALWSYFLPKFDVIEQILGAGTLGDIRSVYTEYGEYLPTNHRIFNPTLAGGPLLDLGTYPVSLLTRLLGVPERLVGLGQPDRSGVSGQLAVVMTGAQGNLGTMATSLYGFTPTNAIITGTRASIWFDTEFHLPGSFTLRSREGDQVLRHNEPPGRHFEGLYYEAAEVSRCVSAGRTETPKRRWRDSLETMTVLDMIRRDLNIDFVEEIH